MVIAANGKVFSAGHDFGDMAGATYDETRELFDVCTRMMSTVQQIPQVVCAKVHALATAAGCQLVASCDLAVAAESAGFATPGGKGGLFCHTPLVAVARNVGRKRALEMAFTGDPISAATAAEWGLINRAVPDGELDAAVDDLMRRATRGSAASKALGKRAFYAQVDMDQPRAYEYATHVMAAGATTRGGPGGHRQLPGEASTGLRLSVRAALDGHLRAGGPPARSRWLRIVRGVTCRSAATRPGEPTAASSRNRSRSAVGTPAARASASSRASSSHGPIRRPYGSSSSVRGSTATSVDDSRRPGAVNAR